MNNKPLFLSFVLSLALFLVGCSSGGGDNPGGGHTPSTGPSNLTVSSLIKGSSSQSPEGDGSGVVEFTAKAENASEYKLLIENGPTLSSSTGNFTHTFTAPGINEYTIHVSAYKGTQFVSKTLKVKVKVNSKLLWSDEFDVDGKPNAGKWTHELGTGEWGWGNDEKQYYTDRLENAEVSNGTLKIRLKKENYSGSNYTSARLVTKGKFDFQYGKIEFRAKIPTGKGTWPALWMLGANIDSTPWPQSGEIDVMEHVGNQQNFIHSTLHYPNHSGGNAVTQKTELKTASTEFHVYSAEWTPTTIKFAIDDKVYHTFSNNSSLPFNHNFFIIMNMAIGGNFGGAIDPNLSEAVFEIDYVRVYQ